MAYSSGDIVYMKAWSDVQTDLKIELVKPCKHNCWIVRVVDQVLECGEYRGVILAHFDEDNQTFVCAIELFGDYVYQSTAAPIDVSDYL